MSLETVAEAERVTGIEFTNEEREMLLGGIVRNLERYESLRTFELPNGLAPAYQFDPVLPGMPLDLNTRSASPRLSKPTSAPEKAPPDLESLAFAPVSQLAELLRRRELSSVQLTRMYLERLKRHDEHLECVVTLCEELALKQAERADQEIASGRYRGPLHGIPWGAKDVLSVKEYPTTWGAAPYKDRVIYDDATVVARLTEAGAVLVAKLSTGELARSEVWFGGRTRNPWNLDQGASGSSAGPASATAAGLVGFSIGTDTRGSIILPAHRCGATGLRPTFGRVSRHGAMVLAWTMDRVGPICRSVEDCALVFDAIHGADGKDSTARDVPFAWTPDLDVASLRVGIVRSDFERDYPGRSFDEASLRVIAQLGISVEPAEVPEFPVEALRVIMDAESAAAFDELTRSNLDDLLVGQEEGSRPNNLRHARFIPAVEYIQASRARAILMHRMAQAMRDLDVLIAPSMSPAVLRLTSYTGHPCVVVPNGFTETGTPVSISFLGGLFKEEQTLAIAHAFQSATRFHLRHPSDFV